MPEPPIDQDRKSFLRPIRVVAILLAAALAAAIPRSPAAAAPSPSPAPERCGAPEHRAFDFWLGEWDVVNKRLQRDGSWSAAGAATARVYPVLGGCGVVEHWEGALGEHRLIGLSVRTWDPRTGSWRLVLNWPPPGRPGFSVLEGAFTHGRGEFFATREGEDGGEVTERYTFSDVRADGLRWDAARSEDGVRWLTYWIMEFRRRPAGAPPLFNGPWIADGRARRCRQGEALALDFLAGRWRTGGDPAPGTPEAAAEAVEVRTIPILDGCAQMETITVGGRPRRFAVRSWDRQVERWVEYSLAADRPGFERLEGGFEGGALVLEGGGEAADGDPARVRRRYRATDHGLERTTHASEDGGESWRPVAAWDLGPADPEPTGPDAGESEPREEG